MFDDDWQRARRCRTRAQLGDCLLGSRTSEFFDVVLVEHFEANRVPERLKTGLHTAVTAGNHADAQQRAHLFVGGEHAFAIGNKDSLARVAVAGRNLHDCLVHSASGCINALQQCNFFTLGYFVGPLFDGVHWVAHYCPEGHTVHTATTTRRGSRSRFGRSQQTFFAQVTRVRKACGVTFDHSNACATVATARHLLDFPVV